MKFCENCSIEISTRDGENLCPMCECYQADEEKKLLVKQRNKLNRKAREDALRSCGLVKVRGALGGTYWE